MTRLRHGVHLLTVAVFTAVGVVAALGNQLRSQDVDPQYARVIVDRTIHYGGTFYENGIHNKGPLEPFVYLVASWFTTYDGQWLAISIFIALASLFLAAVTGWVARATGANRPLAVAAGAVLFVHLTLSGADYAGVLYARNMIVVLLALAFLLAFAASPWKTPRRAQVSALAIGAALGLAVQTLLSSALTAGVIGLAALLVIPLRRARVTMVVAAAITFLSAPVYYGLRGAWTTFWEGWWVQARYMNVGTGRSLGSQLALGLHQFADYYQHRPLAFLVAAVFGWMLAAGWRDGDTRFRVLHAALAGWFLAAWIELAISQRYSSHYFVVSTVPTALMAAALAGHLYRKVMATRRRPLPATIAWPLLAVMVAVFLSGPNNAVDAMRTASRFTSPRAVEVDSERNLGGAERETWALLDLVSHKGDPLLTWSNEPWPYLKYHRVSATRFIWKSFLMGEIYLGRTSPSYVLPHSWQWFDEDVARTKPVVFIETNPRDRGTPFDQLISTGFEPVLSTANDTVYLRSDVASQVIEGGRTEAWTPPPTGASWPSCTRVVGTLAPADGAVRFEFRDTTARTENLHITVTNKQVTTGSDAVDYLALPSASGDGPWSFALVIGRRAAAIVIDGRVRGALRLPPSVSVTAVPAGGATLTDLRTGRAPGRAGCSVAVRQVS